LLFGTINTSAQVLNKQGKALSIKESIDIIVLFSSAMASSTLRGGLDPTLKKMIDDSKLNIGPLQLKLHGQVRTNSGKPPEDRVSILLGNEWIPFAVYDDKGKELSRISFRGGEFGFNKGALFIKDGTEASIGGHSYKYTNNTWRMMN
jgi:hypothetical protein